MTVKTVQSPKRLRAWTDVCRYSVWWIRHIQAEVRFKKEIQRQIDSARAVVVLWSVTSADSELGWRRSSVARDANKLIPVRIDTTLPPLGFRQVQSLTFTVGMAISQAGTFKARSYRRCVDFWMILRRQCHSTGRITNHLQRVLRLRRTRWLVAAAGAIAISVLAFAFLQTRTATRTTSDAYDGRVEIGVFEPMTKTDELERFAKGLQDTVVRVLATNGIKAVRPTRIDEANPLTADSEFVLRGTVDREGEQLVVNAELAPHVFVSERGGPMTSSNVRKTLTRAGEGLGMPVHPHMLRHGCGFKLANQGIDTRSIQAFLGHSRIAVTVVYTEIAPQRFKGFSKD
jgi:hypothetical protein